MSTGTQVCDIVIPGYTLVDRIGSGGYAEVWRADAPGGIQKAVKIVYGYYDDEFACQELKALERIKGVRHPFLLSLERFEIVNGRLAILTELADMSLDQRLRQCRAEGLPGIPREELLRYMADAAEALDFLSQRHNLLHLDIKPENLLVLGDHIKVADFGLVKELASRTQNSLVSGMTPSYASPEMFDDDPTAHSDQYSLAIVYQEMLVGTLPFPGRTAAQLAKQHMQAEPQLMSLPAQDRPVIGRALAKKPTDRFPSCRAFVDALQGRARALAEAPRSTFTGPSPAVPSEVDTKTPSFCNTLRRAPGQSLDQLEPLVTQPVARGVGADPVAFAPVFPAAPAAPAEPFVPEESADVAVPATDAALALEQPTLYLALGGVGIQTLCRFRSLVATRDPTAPDNEAIESIALDTDRNELREASSSRWQWPISADDTLHLPLRLPKSYDNSREILGWVSRRWLYNIPRSLETRGYRPLGRVALVDHSLRVLALMDQKLQRLAALANGQEANETSPQRDPKIRIVLLTGMGGGTGAGMAIDVANAVRSLASGRGIAVEVQGFLICTCFANASSSPLVAANTYSLLTELHHATSLGNAPLGGQSMQANAFESDRAPFDCVYCVPSRARTTDAPGLDALDMVAKYLALETLPEARAALRSCRKSGTPREQARPRALVIKKLGYASLADRKHEFIHELATDLAEAIRHHWLAKDTSADWERLIRAEQQAASIPKLAAAVDGETAGQPVVVPVDDATPLALRGRFKDLMSFQFVSEMLQAVQHQCDTRDDRGRPLLLPREAKPIVDAARATLASLVLQTKHDSGKGARFAGSPALRTLITGGSQLVLRRAIEKFDPKQPERIMNVESIEELLRTECQNLLEESLKHPELAAALTGLIELDKALSQTVEQATMELLQCGCDRRTLIVAPNGQLQEDATQQLLSARPLAAVVSAEVDDVVVVSEEAGISPRSLALGLERVFPGIAEAARRLLTRIDIEWKSLV
jgi:hypothetical protein